MNKTTKPQVLDMKPTSRYADGSPIFSFHTSFPSRGVRAIAQGDKDQEAAFKLGLDYVRKYEQADPYGNMGQCLGVTKQDDGLWHAVVNTYHSNT
jgi:hypothetical protein